ncbi:MAG: M23 family metallopeptidase [Acidimicrobiales bacterium]
MVTGPGGKQRAFIVLILVGSAMLAPGAVVTSRAQTLVEFFGGTTTTTPVVTSDPVSPSNPEAPQRTVETVPVTTTIPVEVSLPLPEVPISLPLPDSTGLPEGSGDGTELSEVQAGAFPPELQEMTDSVQRSRGNSTRALLDALGPSAQYGITPEQAALAGFGRFPVVGFATYSHDWWFPRFGPGWRLHQGTDIFASFNTPVRSPANGHVRISNGGLGGLAVYVVEPNGTYWYLAHLAGLAPGIVEGTPVAVGQTVGFVGDSGNAKGGMPHVHIEIHPMGGAAIDPKATLDQFINEAIAGVPQVLANFAQQAVDAAAQAAAEAAVVDAVLPPATLDGPGRAALLWASSVNPAGGAVELVEAEALRIASNIDWRQHQLGELEADWKRMRASNTAHAWLSPLTPPQLANLLGPI